jgi:hypothetical protein
MAVCVLCASGYFFGGGLAAIPDSKRGLVAMALFAFCQKMI